MGETVIKIIVIGALPLCIALNFSSEVQIGSFGCTDI